jgi:hypothetical protein
MDARYKSKAIIGTSVGVGLFLGGWALIFTCVRGPAATYASAPGLIAIAMILISMPFYLWGCAALANAKGYSTAILLTCFLGWLCPVVVLLALPDKNRHHGRRRRSRTSGHVERSLTSRS